MLEDIRHVLAIAQQTAGRAWVNQIIWQPLVSGAAIASVPDDALAPGGDLEDQVLTAWFREEYLSRRRRGLSVRESFRAAAAIISGRTVPDPDATLIGLLHDLERDPRHGSSLPTSGPTLQRSPDPLAGVCGRDA